MWVWPKEVLALIPEFIHQPNVLGIGEIGLNKNSRNKLEVLEMQCSMSKPVNALAFPLLNSNRQSLRCMSYGGPRKESSCRFS